MSRLISILSSTALAGIFLVWMVWYLGFGVSEMRPSAASVEGLAQPVEVTWSEDNVPFIDARSFPDALRALGYSHLAGHGWHMLFLRQTALGETSKWFGDDMVGLDAFVKSLGFADNARNSWHVLDPVYRESLSAYTDGVNAGLQTLRAERIDEAVLFDIHPEAWEEWHSLAVERLLLWLASEFETDGDTTRLSMEASRFLTKANRLSTWTHLHGFHNGMIWARISDNSPELFYRLVYGQTALPLVAEVSLTWPGAVLEGMSLVGTPILPFASRGNTSWAILPSGNGTLRPVDVLTDIPDASFLRTRSRQGYEHVERFLRSNTDLILDEPRYLVPQLDEPREWRVSWHGFTPEGDWPFWHELMSNGTTDLRPSLWQGSGIIQSPTGDTRTFGPQERMRHFGDMILMGNPEWLESLESGLRAHFDSDERDSELVAFDEGFPFDDSYSAWSASVLPAMLDSVDIRNLPSGAPRAALEYLQNWDFRFNSANIGATIFDQWYAVFSGRRGDQVPLPVVTMITDTLYALPSPTVESLTLVTAVDLLLDRLGSDLSRWRWENVQAAERFFPVFGDPELPDVAPRSLRTSRYAPVEFTASGHPSTPRWVPSAASRRPPSPAAWHGRITTGDSPAILFQRDVDLPGGFLSRYVFAGASSGAVSLHPEGSAVSTRVTLLTPAP